MIGTRKTPNGRATLPLDSSSGLEVVGDDLTEEVPDTDRFSVRFKFH
jgi:hypothetical protein